MAAAGPAVVLLIRLRLLLIRLLLLLLIRLLLLLIRRLLLLLIRRLLLLLIRRLVLLLIRRLLLLLIRLLPVRLLLLLPVGRLLRLLAGAELADARCLERLELVLALARRAQHVLRGDVHGINGMKKMWKKRRTRFFEYGLSGPHAGQWN